MQKSFENIRDLEEIAFDKDIPIDEPFEGMATTDGTRRTIRGRGRDRSVAGGE